MKIAIIPARGGSERIPRKNIKLFFGKPIIAYSIQTAKDSNLFDRVVVSTEDEEISEVAQRWGADVVRRPARLADAYVGTQEVARHALSLIAGVDYACCIYATAPLMCVEDLRRGFNTLTRPKDYYGGAFAFSVGTDPFCDAGQFYFGAKQAFMDSWPIFGEASRIVPIAKTRVCDINTLDDWTRAERMYLALHPEAA